MKILITLTILSIIITHSIFANSEQELVAAVIILEAGGEGYKGMHAVASVIANRCKVDGKSPTQVVTKPYQFSCLNGISRSKAISMAKDGWPKQWEYAMTLASGIQTGRIKDTTRGAYFYQVNSLGVRKWHGEKTMTIGNHSFFRAKNK